MGRKERLKELIRTSPNVGFLSGLFVLIISLSLFLQILYFSHFVNQRLAETVENTFLVLQGKISDYIDLLETIYQIEFISELGELAESKGLMAELIDLFNDPTKRARVVEMAIFYQGKPFLSWQYQPRNVDPTICRPQKWERGNLLTVVRILKTEKRELCSLLTFDVSYRRQVLLTYASFSSLFTLITLFLVGYLTFLTLRAENSRVEVQRKLQAERDLALLGQMAGSFAHELRNSLNTIFLELQKQGISVGSQRPIFEELQKMLQWLEDILFFQKEIKIKPEVFPTEDLLLELKIFLSGLTKTEVTVEMIKKVEEFWGDRFWLKKALENLLKNALEAIHSDGLIKLTLKREGENYVVEVYDNGAPLPERTDQIFEPFFTTKPEGFGLGLYLVKKVVEAHGGEIKIINQPSGKTFRLIWRVYEKR